MSCEHPAVLAAALAYRLQEAVSCSGPNAIDL
jgi:hypothetical protein